MFNHKVPTSLITVIAATAAAIAIVALQADSPAQAGAFVRPARGPMLGMTVAGPCEELPRPIDPSAVAQSMSLATTMSGSRS